MEIDAFVAEFRPERQYIYKIIADTSGAGN